MDAGLQPFELPTYFSWTAGIHKTDIARRHGDNLLPADHGTPYGYADDSRAVQQQLLRTGGTLRPEYDAAVAAQRSLALTAQLRQQALQIAALESLSNALDYHSPLPEHNSAPMAIPLPGDTHSHSWRTGPALPASLNTPYAAGQHVQSDRLLRLQELSYLLNSISPEANHLPYGHRTPTQTQQPTPCHYNRVSPQPTPFHKGVSPQPLPAAKGTGVFLPMACEQLEPTVKPLSRSHSSVSEASRDSTESSSDLSRLDSLGYHSSETDCSYIPAYGCSFPSKLPAGDARRVVGYKIKAVAVHDPLSKELPKVGGS